jgi:hypothetical protein
MEPKIDLTKLVDDLEDTVTISIDNPGNMSGTCGYEHGYGATPPYTYNYGEDTITLSSYPWSNTSITNTSITGGGFAYPNTVSVTGGPYTIGGAGANTGISLNPWATINNSTKIKLDGKDADIEVNGKSLMGMIEQIEQRLNILHPNTELESEWEELRVLGEQYRKLEQHIKDKQATWDRLKAMPPPAID